MAYYDCIWRIEYEMIFNQNVDGPCLFMSWIYVHRDLSNWKKEETQFDARTKQRLFTHDWIIKMLPMLDFSCRLSKCPFHTKIDLSEIIILCKCAFKISVLFFWAHIMLSAIFICFSVAFSPSCTFPLIYSIDVKWVHKLITQKEISSERERGKKLSRLSKKREQGNEHTSCSYFCDKICRCFLCHSFARS